MAMPIVSSVPEIATRGEHWTGLWTPLEDVEFCSPCGSSLPPVFGCDGEGCTGHPFSFPWFEVDDIGLGAAPRAPLGAGQDVSIQGSTAASGNTSDAILVVVPQVSEGSAASSSNGFLNQPLDRRSCDAGDDLATAAGPGLGAAPRESLGAGQGPAPIAVVTTSEIDDADYSWTKSAKDNDKRSAFNM